MTDLTWDQARFDAILPKYIQENKRDLVTILNTKAYYIARRALWNTRKADPQDVRGLRTERTSKRMRSPQDGGLLIGAMINKRLGKGEGLYGSRMRSQINSMLATRTRSVAFLKSGWLPAIRGLDPLAESKSKAGPLDRSAKQFGQPKGDFKAASEGQLVAQIINSASAKNDHRGALEKFGSAALNRAFDDEAASTEEYVLAKMKKRGEQFQSQL